MPTLQRSLTGHPGATSFRAEISPRQFFNFFTSSCPRNPLITPGGILSRGSGIAAIIVYGRFRAALLGTWPIVGISSACRSKLRYPDSRSDGDCPAEQSDRSVCHFLSESACLSPCQYRNSRASVLMINAPLAIYFLMIRHPEVWHMDE